MHTPQGKFPFGRGHGRGQHEGHNPEGRQRGRHGGPGGHFGGPRHEGFRPGGPRARRGDVRLAILSLLGEAPANGYSLIGQIAERTDSRWRPSPGSIYPVLRQLAGDGLATAEGEDSDNAGYAITDAGRAFLAEHEAQAAGVWENGRGSTEGQENLHQSLRKLMGATRELSESGSEEQRLQATQLLDDVRRKIYGLLAE